MIDTEKYKGHTLDDAYSEDSDRGYWYVINLPASSIINGIGGVNKPTAQLIADAPLLLAEVKRLTDIIADYRRFHTWVSEKHYEVIEEWDFLEGVREGYEVIEEWEGEEE